MKVFLTGATGFVGRALALRLRRDGHDVVAMVRSKPRARLVLESAIELADAADDDAIRGALASCDAVVNLAGAPVAARWSEKRRRQLRASRIDLTARLGRLAKESDAAPRVWVQASAVGLYGATGSEDLTEEAPVGSDFLATLCKDWEASARHAVDGANTRLCCLRIGVVLGAGGGALQAMLPAFRLGLGGPIGGGRQQLPWIHLQDVVEVMAQALTDSRYTGAINLTAPSPVTQRTFASALGSVLGRPAFMPAPALAIRLALGEAAQIVTTGQRAVPARLTALGYRFRFPSLEGALADLLAPDDIRFTTAAGWPDVPYLRRRRPRFLLEADAQLDVEVETVWPFFSRPENLAVLTPPTMSFDILDVPDEMSQGCLVDYRIRLGPLPLTWRSRVDVWEPGRAFVDAQLKGPYACWYHEHGFAADVDGAGSIATDRVWYSPPLGPLGVLVNALFVRSKLRDIFSFRRQALRLRFGAEPGAVRDAASAC